MMRRIAMTVIALVGGARAFAAGPPPPIEIARVGSTIDDTETVGVKRAGMLCLPNGAIRWDEVGAGTSMDQRAVVEDAFEDAEVPVTPLGVGPEQVARLRGTVRAATFSVCARNYLGAARTRLSGDATLRVEWRLENAAGGPVRSHVSDVSRTFDTKHAAPLGTLYRVMLTDAARDAATWLKTGAASP